VRLGKIAKVGILSTDFVEVHLTEMGVAPTDRVANSGQLERATRIELAFSAWEADVLPLNYTRVAPIVPRAIREGTRRFPLRSGESESGADYRCQGHGALRSFNKRGSRTGPNHH
jgi:hypothetical protein